MMAIDFHQIFLKEKSLHILLLGRCEDTRVIQYVMQEC